MNARRFSLMLGMVLGLLPCVGAAQDNPWRVPSAASSAYPAETTWLSAGWSVPPPPAQAWGSQRWHEPATPPRPQPPSSHCTPDQRWAAAGPAALGGIAGERRITDVDPYAVPRPSVTPHPSPASWSERPQRFVAGPQLILGDFPPLEGEARQPPPSRRPPPPPEPPAYGYRQSAYPPPAYPPPPPGPSTLSGSWGGYGGYGGYGGSGYGTYGYPSASGVPAPYGWY